MTTAPSSDKPAAFRGLIITAVLLFVMCYTIVHFTNQKFAKHEGATPGAER